MIEPKYLIFFTILIIGVPAMGMLINNVPKFSWVVLFLAIFFTSEMVDINFYSNEEYRGTSRGYEFGMVDISVLILLSYAVSNRKKYEFKVLPAGSLLFFIYTIGCILSLVNSEIRLYGGYEILKLFRVYTFFWVMNNILITRKIIKRAIYFTSFVSLYIFLYVFRDKYLFGMFQCSGPFPHQNSLVMYIMLFVCVHFSMLMASKDSKSMMYWGMITGMEMFCIVSTLSRAGMLLACFGLFIVFLQHLSWKFSLRKVVIIGGLVFVGMVGALKALDSIVERFTNAPEASADTRVVLAIAAQNMANDKVLGIGLNNFSLMMGGNNSYFNHCTEDFLESDFTRGAIVETVYLLIAAETGWYNLGIFFAMLMLFYFRNLVNVFKCKDYYLKVISMGLWGGLTGIYLESCLEWVLRQTNNFYQLILMFAIINSIYRINKSGTLMRPQAF